MRALVGLAALLALAACQSKDPEQAARTSDPVADVRQWLSTEVFAAADAMSVRFAPGLDPREFPPRLMVDTPEQYRFVDLWRVRMVDGRLLIDALMTFSGQPHVVSFHLEQVEGGWPCCSPWCAPCRSISPSGRSC